MEFTPAKLNAFLFFKLPSAWWCGVRVLHISEQECRVTVKHKWFNQNPFKSMYFAVQAMAAELTTGALVMYHIKKSGRNVSMLVTGNKSTFTKKATGRIIFSCPDGPAVLKTIQHAVETGAGQTVVLTSAGYDEAGDCVSEFSFEWSIKVKAAK